MQLTIIDAVWAQQSLRFAVLLLALMLLIISSWSRSRSRFDWSTSVPFRIGEVLLPTLGAAIRIATAFYISAILRFFSWRVTLSTLKVLIRWPRSPKLLSCSLYFCLFSFLKSSMIEVGRMNKSRSPKLVCSFCKLVDSMSSMFLLHWLLTGLLSYAFWFGIGGQCLELSIAKSFDVDSRC